MLKKSLTICLNKIKPQILTQKKKKKIILNPHVYASYIRFTDTI